MKRYQPITLVSNAFSLTDEQAKSYNAQGITFEIIGGNSKISREEKAKLVKYGKQYRLECALSDTGRYSADRYKVKVKAPKVMTDKLSFSDFSFDLTAPDISFEVEGAWKGTDGNTYWKVEENARVRVYYEPGSNNTDTFEYAVYPAGGTPVWIDADKMDVNAEEIVYEAKKGGNTSSQSSSQQTCSFVLQVPQDAWNNVYTVAVRHNGQEAAEQTGTFLQPLKLSLADDFDGENTVYTGQKELRVKVNRISGNLVLQSGNKKDGEPVHEGVAAFDLSDWQLEDGQTITVSYYNKETDETSSEEESLTISFIEADTISISPLGGVYLDEKTPETMRFDVNAQEGLQTQVWLEDENGNPIGEKYENVGHVTFATADLSRTAQIVCAYSDLQGGEVRIPVVLLSETADIPANSLILITEKPALDQDAALAEGGELTGRNAVPNRTVELQYLNGTLAASTMADEHGAFTFSQTGLTPDQEVTVVCEDKLGQKRESSAALTLPLQTITVKAGEITDWVDDMGEKVQPIHWDETKKIYYLNGELVNLPLRGTAHKNQWLTLWLNGGPMGETQADQDGRWACNVTLPDGENGEITVQYKEKAYGEAGTLAYAYYTPRAEAPKVTALLVEGDTALKVQGDPEAKYTLMVDGKDVNTQEAGADGAVTLISPEPFKTGQKVTVWMTNIVGGRSQVGEYTVEQNTDLRAEISGSEPCYLSPDGEPLILTVHGINGTIVDLYGKRENFSDEQRIDQWTMVDGEIRTLRYADVKEKLDLPDMDMKITLILRDNQNHEFRDLVIHYDPVCQVEPDQDSWDALNKGTERITGTADPGAAVILYNGEENVAEAKAGDDGRFEINIKDKDIKKKLRGDVKLSLVAEDPAGNKSERVEQGKKIHFPWRDKPIYLILMCMGLLLFAAFLMIFLSSRKRSGGKQDRPPLPTGTVRLPPRPRKK
ncbi:MAG: hypothetical protein IKN04_00085 [Clostridia bacterium]|nr:hypothetical protein [Clostridia bacterium]MBR6184626.1 hypothetical protein [Clostridia bacterium]